MTETLFLFEETDTGGVRGRSRNAIDMTVRIVDEFDPAVLEIRAKDSQWQKVPETPDDSDNDSECDEEEIEQKPREYDCDDEKEKQSRILQCLSELNKSLPESDEDSESTEKKYDYDMSYSEFTVSNRNHVARLLFNLKQEGWINKAEILAKQKPKSKYTLKLQPYQRNMCMRKRNFSEKSFYVVFYRSNGCCSSSDVPNRIFRLQKKAQNYYRKLLNFSRVEDWNDDGVTHGGRAGCPFIYQFVWNEEKNVFYAKNKKFIAAI